MTPRLRMRLPTKRGSLLKGHGELQYVMRGRIQLLTQVKLVFMRRNWSLVISSAIVGSIRFLAISETVWKVHPSYTLLTVYSTRI